MQEGRENGCIGSEPAGVGCVGSNLRVCSTSTEDTKRGGNNKTAAHPTCQEGENDRSSPSTLDQHTELGTYLAYLTYLTYLTGLLFQIMSHDGGMAMVSEGATKQP